MEQIDLLKWAVQSAPGLVILVWVMLRQEASLKRVTDSYEAQARTNATSLDKNTEMMGRCAAYLARAADIVDDYTQEKRAGAK